MVEHLINTTRPWEWDEQSRWRSRWIVLWGARLSDVTHFALSLHSLLKHGRSCIDGAWNYRLPRLEDNSNIVTIHSPLHCTNRKEALCNTTWREGGPAVAFYSKIPWCSWKWLKLSKMVVYRRLILCVAGPDTEKTADFHSIRVWLRAFYPAHRLLLFGIELLLADQR